MIYDQNRICTSIKFEHCLCMVQPPDWRTPTDPIQFVFDLIHTYRPSSYRPYPIEEN